MKKIENLFLLVLLLVACDTKKADRVEETNDAETVDTVGLEEPSLTSSEEISDGLTKRNVDEFFGDFIFSFIQDHHLQMERVRFPLQYVKQIAGKRIASMIEKKSI